MKYWKKKIERKGKKKKKKERGDYPSIRGAENKMLLVLAYRCIRGRSNAAFKMRIIQEWRQFIHVKSVLGKVNCGKNINRDEIPFEQRPIGRDCVRETCVIYSKDKVLKIRKMLSRKKERKKKSLPTIPCRTQWEPNGTTGSTRSRCWMAREWPHLVSFYRQDLL